MNKKRIMVFSTGGTITSSGAPGVTKLYKDGNLSIEQFSASIPGIKDLASLQFEQPFRAPSYDITIANWLTLANRINELAAANAFDGFVISHGTDTLEETAYFLTLTAKTDKPIVLTASMRPATALSADGPLNFYQAVALAASGQAQGQGALITFADGIFSARDAQKIHRFRAQAFSGGDFGLLGYMRDETVWFINRTEKRHTLQTEFDISGFAVLPKVGVAYYYTEAAPEILDTVTSGAAGLIIAGSPCGSFGSNWKPKVRSLTEKGFIVLRSSRVADGILLDDNIDNDTGTIPSGTLSPQKARILLMLALTKTSNPVQIRRMLETY